MFADLLQSGAHSREPAGSLPPPGPGQALSPGLDRQRSRAPHDAPGANHDEGDTRSASGQAKTEGGGERESRRRVTHVEGDHGEPRTPGQEIGGFERGLTTPFATHPEHSL